MDPGVVPGSQSAEPSRCHARSCRSTGGRAPARGPRGALIPVVTDGPYITVCDLGLQLDEGCFFVPVAPTALAAPVKAPDGSLTDHNQPVRQTGATPYL